MKVTELSHLPNGVRGLALKRLSKARFIAPNAQIYDIPQWKCREIRGGLVPGFLVPQSHRISSENLAAQTVSVPLVFSVKLRSLHLLLLPPMVTDNLALWEISTQQKNISSFSIKVFGKRFRRASQEAESKTRQQSLFNSPNESLPNSESKPHTNIDPFGYLYDLLYPPPSEIADESIPKFTDLRDYQKDGVQFLVQRDHALLADDMGLGKTAQCSIALAILRKSERVGTALIICPRAVISQWKDEAKKWGDLHVRVVDGTPEQRRLIWVHNTGVLLVTPHIVERDRDWIEDKKFDLVVCDDVSMLKNPDAKITRAIRAIPRQRSWCLNGTPLEIRPEDFVNVMEFVCPGLFKPHERHYAPSSHAVKNRVAPYFLRRTKQKYLVESNELKPKIVKEPISLEMSLEQWERYRVFEQGKWDVFQKEDTKSNKMHIFAILLELVQICNFDETTKKSAKTDYLMRQLTDVLSEKQPEVKAIVFSRFVKTLQHLETRMAKFSPLVYHGGLSDKQRDAILHQFRTEGRLLLMSTKSGARGLNLQEANHVFHFDRTWNPVDALQGEDRCWRFGQKREVYVSRYIQKGTIEERIDANLRCKIGLIDEYVESMADDPDSDVDSIIDGRWSMEELIDLLRPSRSH
ncbi:DEAD/DEAH box helicase [Nostoc sp. CHAB 5824]|nr:DEAD/DEAH box helicase [Nostoc sp. CHAB 5824]